MTEPANPYSGATPLHQYNSRARGPYTPTPRPYTPDQRPFTPQSGRALRPVDSRENLVQGAAPLGGSPSRQPTVPNVTGYDAYRGVTY